MRYYWQAEWSPYCALNLFRIQIFLKHVSAQIVNAVLHPSDLAGPRFFPFVIVNAKQVKL